MAFDRQARELVKDRRIENVILADTSGQQLSNTRRPAGTPLPRVGDPELVKRALFSQRPVISDLFIGQLLKQPLISIGVPIVRDDQVINVLISSILPERFAELLMQQQVTSGLVELLDRNGKVIAQNRTLKTAVGQLALQPLLNELRKSSQGEVVVTIPEGGAALVVFSGSPYSGWTVIKTIPNANLFGEVWRTVGWLMGALLLLLGTSLGLAWTMGGRIAAAIRSLGEPAAALGYGQPVSVPELPIREVNEVAVSLARASTVLVEAGHALTASEARLRGILEPAPDAIIAIDERLSIVVFNPAA